jgi:hypothetical protein
MKRTALALCVGLALVVGVATATAGGNSDAAHACQQNGWQNLVRQDGTPFLNTGDCVSYAAQGGVLKAKPSAPTCTAGSENFASDAESSQPTTFSGGTIDPSDYAPGASTPNGGSGGSILVSGPYFGGFATGTHFLFTGWGVNSPKLTFTNPVKTVQVDAQSNKTSFATDLTLTGYDASGHPVPGATATGIDDGMNSVTLTINSQSANIKFVTISTNDPLTPPTSGTSYGLGFTNLIWGC